MLSQWQVISLDRGRLGTIFQQCNLYGTCCKKYRKIRLHDDEVVKTTKMGGHIGVDIPFIEIKDQGLQLAREDAIKKGKIFMIHPGSKEWRRKKPKLHIHHPTEFICQSVASAQITEEQKINF